MKFVMDLIQRGMKRRVERYENVLIALEEAFSSYEARQVSISGYLDAVCAIDQRFRSERPAWLHLCDWSLALRWINTAERRAFREACDALDWCRNWAVRQRGADVTSCLESARANADVGFGPALGAVA